MPQGAARASLIPLTIFLYLSAGSIQMELPKSQRCAVLPLNLCLTPASGTPPRQSRCPIRRCAAAKSTSVCVRCDRAPSHLIACAVGLAEPKSRCGLPSLAGNTSPPLLPLLSAGGAAEGKGQAEQASRCQGRHWPGEEEGDLFTESQPLDSRRVNSNQDIGGGNGEKCASRSRMRSDESIARSVSPAARCRRRPSEGPPSSWAP